MCLCAGVVRGVCVCWGWGGRGKRLMQTWGSSNIHMHCGLAHCMQTCTGSASLPGGSTSHCRVCGITTLHMLLRVICCMLNLSQQQQNHAVLTGPLDVKSYMGCIPHSKPVSCLLCLLKNMLTLMLPQEAKALPEVDMVPALRLPRTCAKPFSQDGKSVCLQTATASCEETSGSAYA